MPRFHRPKERTSARTGQRRQRGACSWYRPIGFECLEDRRLLASVFTNAFNQYDVTDDGFVVAEDVLSIINYINANQSGPLPAVNNASHRFIDVDGDSEV